MVHRSSLFVIGCCIVFCLTHSVFSIELIKISESNWADVAPHGKEVDWIYGDYVLRNSTTTAVIASPNPQRNANMTVHRVGGCLIDVTEPVDPNDQLSAYYPAGGYFLFSRGRQVKATLPLPFNDEHVEHVGISFTGTLNERMPGVEQLQGLKCELTYWLCEESPAIRIETTIENTASDPREIKLFDIMRADRDFESGVDSELNLFHTADYWWKQAYGVIGVERTVSLEQQSRNLALHFLDDQKSDMVAIAPNTSVSLVRYLCHARHDLGIRNVANQMRNVPAYPVTIRVEDKDGPISGAKIRILRDDNELGKLQSDKEGEAQFVLPSGTYKATVSAIGRRAKSQPLRVEKQPCQLAVALAATGYVSVCVRDSEDQPLACKVAFQAVPPKEAPFFGPDTFVWEVHNLIYSEDGAFKHAVPPGNYNVMISHGPEYDAIFRPITVKRGKAHEVYLETTLHRTVDSTGWVSADFHSHSSPSGDNTCSQLGRVLNLLAEHIEFAPCTEHNRVSSYVPHLKRLGAVGRMATCSGIELTGSVLPINHQNAFPLVEHPHHQDGGGPHTSDDPVKQIKRLRDWDEASDKIVQENHPNIVRLLCDANDDGVADEGFREMFPFMDLIEVHPPQLILAPPEPSSGENPYGNPSVHWLQMLNLGYRIYGAVNTDAHYTFHGSGFLRNYVKCKTDDPSEIQVKDIIRSCQRGHLVMSNGPFMEVIASTNENQHAIPGDDLSVTDGKVRLFIKVQCANWLDVNRVQVLLNGRPAKQLNFQRRANPKNFTNGVTKFEQTMDVQLQEDTHIIVVALGEGLALGSIMGPKHGSNMPAAISNPIFVDIGNDGFQPNGDLLDIPLPATAEELHKSHGLNHEHE